MVLDALEVLIVYGIKKDGIMNRKYKQKFLFLDLESYVAIYFLYKWGVMVDFGVILVCKWGI